MLVDLHVCMYDVDVDVDVAPAKSRLIRSLTQCCMAGAAPLNCPLFARHYSPSACRLMVNEERQS